MHEEPELYTVTTVVSTHRVRYVIPVSGLQAENLSMIVNPVEWAEDSVVMGAVKEFSQEWFGEQIIDTNVVSEEQMLELFDEDNDYLSSWSQEKKVKHVQDWKFEDV